MTVERPVILKRERYHAVVQGFREDLEVNMLYQSPNGLLTNRLCSWSGVAYIAKGSEIREDDKYEQIGFETPCYPVYGVERMDFTLSDALVNFHQRAQIPGKRENIDTYRAIVHNLDNLPRIIDLAISDMVGKYRLSKDKLELIGIDSLNIKDLVQRGLCYAGTIDQDKHMHLHMPPSVRLTNKKNF